MDVFNTAPTPWISDIEGFSDVVESSPMPVDCVINSGPGKGCNATSRIGGSPDACVVGVLSLSARLRSWIF